MINMLLGEAVEIDIGTKLWKLKLSPKVEALGYGTVVGITARDVHIEFNDGKLVKFNHGLSEARKPNEGFLNHNTCLCTPEKAQERVIAYNEKADKDAAIKIFTDRLAKSFRVTADFRNYQTLHKYIEDDAVKAAMDNLVKVLNEFDERKAQEQHFHNDVI